MRRILRLTAAVGAALLKAFGSRLAEVREELAGRIEPEKLNRVGFRHYEAFRPEVPAHVRGCGAKGELGLRWIRGAMQ